MLVKERLNDLLEADHISISFDGPEDVHDYQRGKGTCRKAIEATMLAKDKGLPVSFLTVVTKYNVIRLDEVLDVTKKIGIGALFQPVEEYEHAGAAAKGMVPEKDNVTRAFKALMGKRHVINSEACLKQFVKPFVSYGNCAAGRLFCRIDPDGTMHPCGRAFRKKDAPNVREGFLKGFQRLGKPVCNSCLCALQIEASIPLRMRLASIKNLAM